MEFIACLDKAQPAEGLSPTNTDHLEKVYKDAVGEKKEIDLGDFKKIVQSKNMFFVERMFKIFDADGSGTISLDEFMRVMCSFSRQTPEEKLRYLFQVYDLNNDGTIQFSELRNVISECMKENGLNFSETELDELTRMLFEDADTDRSGSVTFSEFRDQLKRHPAFMENLTLSVERWLLPQKQPASTQQRLMSWRPRKLNWKYIRNNWTSVTFLLAYIAISVGLFVARAIKYKDHNNYVILARACGQCLNFNCAFALVLVLRQTLTWLRTHGLGLYLPIDQHLYYHKLAGCCIMGYSIVHTLMHICNFASISDEHKPLHLLLFSTEYGIGWVNGSACLTGWLLLLILVIMLISAMPFVRRNGKFEVFYCLHQLAFVFWICLVIHGPHFWKWFITPAVLYLVETAIRINRNLSSSKRAYVQQGVLLPSTVTHLVVKRPPKFDFRPGDYVYINIPAIAKYEWHPFTISSAPELDDVIWLHIRGVGEWTNTLYKFFDKHDKEAVLSDELARELEACSSTVVQIAPKDTTSPSVAQPDFTPSCSVFESSPGPSKENARVKTLLSRSVSEKIGYHNPVQGNFCTTCPNLAAQLQQIPRTVSQMTVEIPPEQSVGSDRSVSSNCFEVSLSPMSTQMGEGWQRGGSLRRTSFSSTSTSRAVQRRNLEDARSIIAEHKISTSKQHSRSFLRPPSKFGHVKEKRRSVRVSVADKGFRRCQTVIVMPTVAEDEEDSAVESPPDLPTTEEEVKDLEREAAVENVVVTQKPLKIFLDGPYGSPTRHIFQARHAVLIATGIGVTPFASILQSIMYQYRKSRHTCPNCSHRWTDPLPVSSMHLRKVDFFWLNRHQRSFEWFVSLLSELEVEQAQLQEKDRFLDIHMYITSALDKTDMKAVGLQMALDLLYQKEKRCLITGLKSRTQPGRPDWTKVFKEIADQKKGKVTVFFCGPNQLGKTLLIKCNEFGFRFRKEIF